MGVIDWNHIKIIVFVSIPETIDKFMNELCKTIMGIYEKYIIIKQIKNKQEFIDFDCLKVSSFYDESRNVSYFSYK